MKRLALAASCLLIACDQANVARTPADGSAGPADASLEIADALGEAEAAGRGPTDATLDVGAGGDASVPPGEGGLATACAGASVPPSTLSCTGLYADVLG